MPCERRESAGFYRGHNGLSLCANMTAADMDGTVHRESSMILQAENAALVPDMKSWRHHLHAHPETAFEETATSAFVAEKLEAIGLDVHTGLAKPGVVGVLRCGGGSDAIGLRADM